MTRKEARELLMQLLYQMELMNDHTAEAKDAYIAKNFSEKGHKDYANQLMDLVLTNKDEIDAKLNENSNKWTTNRMPKVDLAILRLAACELIYMEAIPDAVAINEAVDMAKKYSSDESKGFINGILGKIAKEKDA